MWEVSRLPAYYRLGNLLWECINFPFGEAEHANQRFVAGYDFKFMVKRA